MEENMDNRTSRSGRRIVLIAALILGLAILACGRGRGQEPGTPESTEAVEETNAPESTEEEDVGPVESSGGCMDDMTFIADVTVPDGTVFGPNEPFTKTWQLQNAGSCDWSGYQIVFLDGEPMGTMAQDIPDMPAGEVFDLSIEMTAPGGAGDYTGRWQVVSPEGYSLGTVTCVITVEGAAAEESGEEPEGEPETSLPELVMSDSFFDPWPLEAGQPFTVGFTIYNFSEASAGAFSVFLDFADDTGLENCAWDIGGMGPGEEVQVSCNRPAAPPAGTYSATLMIDTENEVDEGPYEGNNTIPVTLTVEGGEESASMPNPASNLTITGWGMNTSTISWDDNSDNEDGFYIRDRDLGRIGEVGANVTSFVIDFAALGIDNCQVLHVRVRAHNAAGGVDSETLEVPGTAGCQ
jgi:hypothetical protein